MDIKIYKLREAAEFLKLHPQTLQRLDREKKLIARRTKTNRRYYLESDLLEFLGLEESNDMEKG